MKLNYDTIIKELKEKALIAEGDLAVYCRDSESSAMLWGGLIGAALTSGSRAEYIMAINQNTIKLFDLETNTVYYKGTMLKIQKEEIISCKKPLGSYEIRLKTQNGKLRLLLPIKQKGYLQKDTVKNIFDIVKIYYS